MAEPPTVLYVDHSPALGGAEHSLLGLLGALDRSRYRPVLAAPPGPLSDAVSALGIDVRRLPLPRLQRQLSAPWHLSHGVQALRNVAAEEQVALVHGNVLRASVYAALAARAAGCPLLWHVRDIHRRSAAAWWLCRQADAVLAISQVVAAALPCTARAQVVYNPVGLPTARPRSRAELGLPNGPALVAMVASLRRWKGHEAFLEMAARAAGRTPAHYVVVGGSIFDDDERDYAAELAARAVALGIDQQMSFLGQRDDLADLWPHLSLLVHPATAEPFGRVVAEALVAGVPVVAYRDGGVPEIVDDGESGLLVPPGDVAALADAVVRLLCEPEERGRMARIGQQRAGRRFAPATHARTVEAAYDRLLANRAGHSRPARTGTGNAT